MPVKTIRRWNASSSGSTRNEKWVPQLYPSSAGCRTTPAGEPAPREPRSTEALREAKTLAEVDGAPLEESTSTCSAKGDAETNEHKHVQADMSAAGERQSCSATTCTPQANGALPAEEAHASNHFAILAEQSVDARQVLEEGAEADLFFNTCSRCGETLLLVIDGGTEFVCEEAGASCSGAVQATHSASCGAPLPDVLLEPFDKLAGADLEPDDQTYAGMTLRMQLMRRVLAEDLTALAVADLFLIRGEQPPKPEELDGCREDIQRQARERKAGEKSEAAYQATKAKQSKQQKYVDGRLVDVQKGSRYVVEPKETATEKAKTSLSLVIQGSHRGGNGQKKEKKGPRS